MVKKVQKFYLSKVLLVACSVLSVCCYLFDAVCAAVNGQFADYAWIFFALVILLQWAFFKGQINVQKMLFGAILIAMVKEQAELMALNAAYNGGKVLIQDIALLIISIVIFVFHIYQQVDHAGKSFAVLMNQLLGFVGFVFLFFAIRNLAVAPASLSSYVFLFGYVSNIMMIICMETRVEAYKQIRDKARREGTWTEEKRQESKKLFKL